MGFPGSSDGKESAYNPGLIPGSGRSPREGNGYPLQVFLAWRIPWKEDSVGSSPWGYKESDTTERLTHTHKGFYSWISSNI